MRLRQVAAFAVLTAVAGLASGTANAFFGMGDWFDGPGWGGYHGYG